MFSVSKFVSKQGPALPLLRTGPSLLLTDEVVVVLLVISRLNTADSTHSD